MRVQESIESKPKAATAENTGPQSRALFPRIARLAAAPSCGRRKTEPDNGSPIGHQSRKWSIKNKFIDHYMPPKVKMTTDSSELHFKGKGSKDEDAFKQPSQIFFTHASTAAEGEAETDRDDRIKELKSAIQKSQDFISLVRTNKQKLTKLRSSNLRETNLSQHEAPKDIYNYLSRKVVMKRQKKISSEMVSRYESASSVEKLADIQSQSRRFLLQKMKGDFRNYSEVDSFKKEQIKDLLLEEMGRIKQDYSRDYHQRFSVPYLSFLTLSHEEKQRVISKQYRRSII